MNYGIVTLVVPPVWITSVLLLFCRPEVSDEAKTLAFVSGIVILGALIILVIYAVIGPWFMVDWYWGRGDDV